MKTDLLRLGAVFFFSLFISVTATSQVSISTDNSLPDNSAMLDVKSTSRGMLVPRLSSSQRSGIASPAPGLLVYDTDTKSFWYYDVTWIEIVVAGVSNAWKLTGNTGTDSTVNYLGTSDARPLVVGTNGSPWFKFTRDKRIEILRTDSNTYLGMNAGFSNYLSTGKNNVGLGADALMANNSGNKLTAVGAQALYKQTGYGDFDMNSTGIGYRALYNNQFGHCNTALGAYSLYVNLSEYNTAAGESALRNNLSGSYNTAIGYKALQGTSLSTGSENVAVGSGSLLNNGYGSYNVAIGTQALYNSNQSYNTALGWGAGKDNGSGYNNTFIGYQANIASASNLYNVVAVGYNTTATASNEVRLGNENSTSLYCMGAWVGQVAASPRDLYVDLTGKIGYQSSSLRYKTEVEDMEDITWIYKLRPVNYQYKNDPTRSKQYGLIAEEVEQVNPRFISYDKDGRVETVLYTGLIAPIIKTVQVQQKEIEQLIEQNRELIRRLNQLERENQ